MQFFAKEIMVDQYGKATNFRLHSLQYPHMRALHLAWISFMTAFLSWYSIPPIVSYIAQDLEISATQIYNSNVVAVSSTMLGRITIGIFCERFGPRRVIAGLLLVGSIPCAMTGFLQNGQGLIGLRFVIGILGATFVPTQFWTTQMFAPSVVGTANAMTAGWGTMGGGVTYLVMPAIYGGLRRYLPLSKAWRVVFVFPAAICIIMAIANLVFGTDTPQGDWLKSRKTEAEAASDNVAAQEEKKEGEDKDGKNVLVKEVPDDEASIIQDVRRDESLLMACNSFLKTLRNPSVLIMVAVPGIPDQISSTAAYVGSIFGLLNIFSRLTGGLFSDFMARRLHLPGRILALFLAMVLEAVFLISFSYGFVSMKVAVTLMVFFSFFEQHVCGSTFAIVPFVDPVNNGKVIGIVGAGGNLGGLLFNLMFRGFGNQFEHAFLCQGCIALLVAVIGCSNLRIQEKTIWDLFRKRHT